MEWNIVRVKGWKRIDLREWCMCVTTFLVGGQKQNVTEEPQPAPTASGLSEACTTLIIVP